MASKLKVSLKELNLNEMLHLEDLAIRELAQSIVVFKEFFFDIFDKLDCYNLVFLDLTDCRRLSDEALSDLAALDNLSALHLTNCSKLTDLTM